MTSAETFADRHADAYERLIMDVVRGNQTLFITPRRGRGRLGLGRSDPGGLERLGRNAKGLSLRHARVSAGIALIERDGRTGMGRR